MRFPAKPPRTGKHTEERLKLAASGLQAVALTIIGAIIIAPVFNHIRPATSHGLEGGILLVTVAEFVAMQLLRYIPTMPIPKERDHG